MSPSDFRDARGKYIIWAKLICAEKFKSETPNRDSIIEDSIEEERDDDVALPLRIFPLLSRTNF